MGDAFTPGEVGVLIGSVETVPMAKKPDPDPPRPTLFGKQSPRIYAAMVQAMQAVTHVGKDGYNQQQSYPFRGIDGVINALGPAMRQAGIFMTSELLDIKYRDAMTTGNKPTREVLVQVRYRFTAVDGSYVETVAPGESLDQSDKGTAKAMSVALRIALLQAFALPTQEPTTDHDGHYHTRGGEPRMSEFERTTGLVFLAAPTQEQREQAGPEMMAAALQQAIDFKTCIDEHSAWLTPTNGDESPTWGDLYAARMAAEVAAIDTAAEGAELWGTLKAAKLLDLEYDGKRLAALMSERSKAIKERNAQALDTITQQVLEAPTEEDLMGPALESVEAAYELGRITSEQKNGLLQLAGERLAKLKAEDELPEAAPEEYGA